MWVLILSFAAFYDQNSTSVTTQEFTSRDRCMAAATLFIKQNTTGSTYASKPKAICVPK